MNLGKGEKIPAEKALVIGQRVEIFPFEAERGYSSRIEDITDDRIMVAMPMDEKHRPVIPAPGEHLMCKAGGKGTSYRFFAIYKDKGRDPIPVLFISRPDVVEKVQNREFVRVQVTRPVVLRAIGDDGAVGEMILTTTNDLSGGGVGVVHNAPLPLDSNVTVEMENIPNIELLKTLGRVVRCDEVDVAGKKIYKIGIKFLELSRMDQNKLIKYIFELQRKNLAKGIGK